MSDLAPSPLRSLTRQIIIDLAVMTAIGAFLAVISPFGSINVPLAVRLVSWIGFAWLGYCFFRPMESVVNWAERTLDLPRWGLWFAGCLMASAPMTAAVLVIGSLPRPLVWHRFEVIMGTYFSVLVIGGAVTLLFNLVKPGQREATPQSTPALSVQPIAPVPVAATPNLLLDQLPPDLGSEIIALEMEDHYVRVHTALGSALVLMRLRDAMALIGDTEGMQVHRSWWVARGAVEDVLRDGRNLRLKLARGIAAPVARAKIGELRDARWI